MSNPTYHEFTSAANAEQAAKLRKFAGPPQDVEKVIIREWPRMSRATADQLYATLYALDSITNPKVDGQTITGTYRQTDLHVESDGHDTPDGGLVVVQVLTEGWITLEAELAAAAQVLKDQDSKLSPHSLEAGSSRTEILTVYRGVDPAVASSLADNLTLAQNGRVRAWTEKQEDGSCRIYTATDARTWAGGSDTYLRRVKELGGTAGTTTTRQVDVWTHLPYTTIATLVAYAEGTAAIYDAAVGYARERFEYRIDADGFGEVTKVQTIVDDAAPSSGEEGHLVTVGNPSSYLVTDKYEIYRWHNVPTTRAAQALVDLQTAPSAAYLVGYVTVDGNLLTDPVVTITQRLNYVNNANPLTNGEFQSNYHYATLEGGRNAIEYTYYRLSAANATTILGALSTYKPTGTLTDVRQIKHPDGAVTLVLVSKGAYQPATADAGDIYTEDMYRSYIEKMPDANAADGYQWREVEVEYSIKLTTSAATAYAYAKAGLYGSFSRHLHRGQFYAERVTDYAYGAWNSTTLTGT